MSAGVQPDSVRHVRSPRSVRSRTSLVVMSTWSRTLRVPDHLHTLLRPPQPLVERYRLRIARHDLEFDARDALFPIPIDCSLHQLPADPGFAPPLRHEHLADGTHLAHAKVRWQIAGSPGHETRVLAGVHRDDDD